VSVSSNKAETTVSLLYLFISGKKENPFFSWAHSLALHSIFPGHLGGMFTGFVSRGSHFQWSSLALHCPGV
jgi:hypothetical protein